MQKYDSTSIAVLEGLEPVRTRPGMYIGGTGTRGLHHLVWEILDNSVDEAMANFATKIDIILDAEGGVTISDNGRGIPVDIHPSTGLSTLETVLTRLHAGGKFDSETYKVSGGLHGVGASVVNALASVFEVWVERDGKIHALKFENGGQPTGPLEVVGTSEKTGTKIRFVPDFTIMEKNEWDFAGIVDRVRQTAYLNRNLALTVTDARSEQIIERKFCFEGGIKQYVNDLNVGKTALHEQIIYAQGEFNGEKGTVQVEVAMQYDQAFQSNIVSYANNIATNEGGAHVTGFMDALVRIFNNYAEENKIFKNEKEKLTREDVKEGLTAIISIRHPNPMFEGQTKGKLANRDARTATNKILSHSLERFLLENPFEARQIIDKVMLTQRARFNAQAAREATFRKDAFEIGSLPGKLADCSTKSAADSELFIVEGNSAGGSAKMGRNREIQAILPLRGKVINAQKAHIDKVFKNNEIGSLITALGTGVASEFNLQKLRYYKVIIMTDADVDGAHIRTLLLTFLYRHMRPLIEYGFVYIAQPPLYKITTSRQTFYAYSEKEKEQLVEELDANSKISLQRYKGLGEMNPGQLWETTMDPERRKMQQVQIEDAAAADLTFSILMGDDVEKRREFIQENARYARVEV